MDPRIQTALVSVNPTTKNPAWHGAPTALGILRGVRAAVAVWRPYPGANNIREIALHIAFWENSVANRLSGQKAPVGFEQRKTGWAIMHDAVDDEQWKREIDYMKEIHARLAEVVTNFDPNLLDQPAGERSSISAINLIHGVAEHTLYHTAQIEMIKTLAGHNEIK